MTTVSEENVQSQLLDVFFSLVNGTQIGGWQSYGLEMGLLREFISLMIII